MSHHSVPAVTVIMPSYNHARFIAMAIKSVLNQTFSNFELIVVDDGSSDDSVEIVKTFEDPRIRAVFLEKNEGGAATLNKGVSLARGDYIALCNSDDCWVQNKLDVQLSIFKEQSNLVATFSDVIWIDDQGTPLDKSRLSFSTRLFRRENRSRHEWLHDLIVNGNCLCHPSIMIRREALNCTGPYDNRFRQLPDFQKWIALVQFGEIFVSPEQLVKFRIHDSNTSAVKPDTGRRDANEFRLIIRSAFFNMSAENFSASFGLKSPPLVSETHLKIEKALFLISYKGRLEYIFREAGLDLMYELLASDEARFLLSSKYGYDINSFYSDMGASSPWVDNTGFSVGGKVNLTTVPTRRLAGQILKRGLKFLESQLKRPLK
jgi:glycosyltransferase involved in cell wall biosynthesis